MKPYQSSTFCPYLFILILTFKTNSISRYTNESWRMWKVYLHSDSAKALISVRIKPEIQEYKSIVSLYLITALMADGINGINQDLISGTISTLIKAKVLMLSAIKNQFQNICYRNLAYKHSYVPNSIVYFFVWMKNWKST